MEILDNIGVYFNRLTTGETFGDELTDTGGDLELNSCEATISSDGASELSNKFNSCEAAISA